MCCSGAALHIKTGTGAEFLCQALPAAPAAPAQRPGQAGPGEMGEGKLKPVSPMENPLWEGRSWETLWAPPKPSKAPARFLVPVPGQVWAARWARGAAFGPVSLLGSEALTRALCHCLSSDSFLVTSNHCSDVPFLHLNLYDVRCGGRQGPLLFRAEERAKKELTLQPGHIRCQGFHVQWAPLGSPEPQPLPGVPCCPLRPHTRFCWLLQGSFPVPNERVLFLVPALSPDF